MKDILKVDEMVPQSVQAGEKHWLLEPIKFTVPLGEHEEETLDAGAAGADADGTAADAVAADAVADDATTADVKVATPKNMVPGTIIEIDPLLALIIVFVGVIGSLYALFGGLRTVAVSEHA